MKWTTTLPPPVGDALVRALTRDPYDAGDSWISATRLVAPPLIIRLEAEHGDEVEQDVTEGLWSLFGSAVHHVLASRIGREAGYLIEQRVGHVYGERKLTAAVDMFDPATATVIDWKVTSAWSLVFAAREDPASGGVKPEWEGQLNVEAALLRANGHPVEHLANALILRDWTESQAARAGEDDPYPQSAVVVLPVALWELDAADHYIAKRMALHAACREAAAANVGQFLCSPEERWARPTTWKVFKNANKIAERGSVTTDEARAFEMRDRLARQGRPSDKYRVERVQGDDSVRCRRYCRVRQWCPHGQRLQNGGV